MMDNLSFAFTCHANIDFLSILNPSEFYLWLAITNLEI